jgi:hypothetical protein
VNRALRVSEGSRGPECFIGHIQLLDGHFERRHHASNDLNRGLSNERASKNPLNRRNLAGPAADRSALAEKSAIWLRDFPSFDG